jgi:hypothetical protein
MRSLAFWQTVTADRAGLLEDFVQVLREEEIRFCVVGGQAVNAYVEPVVSLDLDLAVAADQLERLTRLLEGRFRVERFPHSVNISVAGSDVRIQLQTDPRYADFVDGAETRDVLGLTLPVAKVEDVLQGKIWAAADSSRRASKRQKDLADIARILEAHPDLRSLVPQDILERLF